MTQLIISIIVCIFILFFDFKVLKEFILALKYYYSNREFGVIEFFELLCLSVEFLLVNALGYFLFVHYVLR